MRINHFYRVALNNKLMAQVSLDENNSVEIEIERGAGDDLIKNEEAYASFSREIADFKASPA